MENASKALIIAGAILLSILIIAIGMYIYTSSTATIKDSMQDMTSSEIEAFNSNLTTYAGNQTWSQVKAMLGRLAANAKTYEDQITKIPTVSARCGDNGANPLTADRPNEESHPDEYIAHINEISNDIKLKHTYWVRTEIGAAGLVNRIYVDYENDGDAQHVCADIDDPDTTR